MRETDVRKAASSLVRELPKVAVGSTITLLFWLLGSAVFIPLGQGVDQAAGSNVAGIIGVIFLVPIIYELTKVLMSAVVAVEALSTILALHHVKDRRHRSSRKQLYRSIGSIILLLLTYLALNPFIASVHPALGGILLVVIVLMGGFFGLAAAHSLSSELVLGLAGESQETPKR